MNRPYEWTVDEIKKIAKKYKTLIEFKTNNNKAYQAAVRRGIMKEVSGHMTGLPPGRTPIWTEKTIIAEARKYKKLADFRKLSRSAYVVAHRLGILDKVKKVYGGKNQGG